MRRKTDARDNTSGYRGSGVGYRKLQSGRAIQLGPLCLCLGFLCLGMTAALTGRMAAFAQVRQLAPWKPPYTVLPAPTDAAPFEKRLGDRATAVWLEGDVLSVAHREKAEQVMLDGGLQQPLQRIAGTDIWVFQARMPDWEKAFFTYTFISSSLKPGTRLTFDDWRGTQAPKLPARAKELQGKLLERVLHSDSMGQDRHLTIYLPPNAPKQDLPAVFMADGQGCEEYARVLEPLILAHKVRPVAIVGVHNAFQEGLKRKSPDADPRTEEYLPGYVPDVFAKHLEFFCREVPAYAAREFGISTRREDRAIFGFSNGGGFAWAASLRHPEVFGHALPFSASRGAPEKGPKPEPMPTYHFVAGHLESFHMGTEEYYGKAKEWGASPSMELYFAGHDPKMWELGFSRALPAIFPSAASTRRD